MRILKPGDSCPCCGQSIPAGLPMESILLLSYIQYGLALREVQKGQDPIRPPEERDPAWQDWLRTRFERMEGS